MWHGRDVEKIPFHELLLQRLTYKDRTQASRRELMVIPLADKGLKVKLDVFID